MGREAGTAAPQQGTSGAMKLVSIVARGLLLAIAAGGSLALALGLSSVPLALRGPQMGPSTERARSFDRQQTTIAVAEEGTPQSAALR